MKNMLNVLVIFSLAFLSGCATTLTGAQHCALVGEVRDTGNKGASVKSGNKSQELQLQISGQSSFTMGGIGAFACRPPETDEEKTMVKKLRPEAEKIKTNNNIKIVASYGVTFLLLLGIPLFFLLP